MVRHYIPVLILDDIANSKPYIHLSYPGIMQKMEISGEIGDHVWFRASGHIALQ